MASQNVVVVKRDGQIAKVIMSRPEKLNALNIQMFRDLLSVFQEIAADDGIRVMIVTGEGRAFCAGADFSLSKVKEGTMEFGTKEDLRSYTMGAVVRGKLVYHAPQLGLALFRMDKPTIAMVNGNAIGAGFGIALACDMRVGSEKAGFQVGYTRVNAVPPEGESWLLPRIVGLGRARQMIFTSEMVDANEAYRIGLLNKLAPHASLEQETMDLAEQLLRIPPAGQRMSKLHMNSALQGDFEGALAFSGACSYIADMTEDHLESIKAMGERRAPNFKDR